MNQKILVLPLLLLALATSATGAADLTGAFVAILFLALT